MKIEVKLGKDFSQTPHDGVLAPEIFMCQRFPLRSSHLLAFPGHLRFRPLSLEMTHILSDG